MGKQKSASHDDNKHEQELQAVLLADSFTKSFRPLSLDQSRVLCPLNNVTLLDYALEFLAGAGVQELFVVCTKDDVEKHVSQQSSFFSERMTIHCIKDSSLTNAGDALREIDQRNLIQSDPFLLMHGDVVTNVDLKPAMEAHKARHKQDSSAIMTLLFQNVGACSSPSRFSDLRAAARDDLVVGFDPSQQNRILVFDDHKNSSDVRVPCSFFSCHPQVELHYDLMDCGIDICSPDLLGCLEFDYRDLRREFVANSVAEEEEGLQHKLHAHLVGDSEYAARVHDFHSYHAVSQDLLQRWCYPVVPDNLTSRDTRYALQRHYLYREQRQPAKVGRSSVLKGPGMIGQQCFIGERCQVEATVMGPNCHIQSNVTLRGCHLWGNAVVEEGATVVDSVLGFDCTIRAGATVSRGCVIGNGCVVGSNVVLREFTRITMATDTDGDGDDDFGDFDDSEEESDDEGDNDSFEFEKDQDVAVLSSDHNVVGSDGVGRVWYPATTLEEDDESEDEEEESPVEVAKSQSIGYDPSELYKKRLELQEEEDDGFSDDDEPLDGHFDGGDYPEDGAITFGGDSSSNFNEHGMLKYGRDKGVDVVKELKAICLEHEMTSPVENLAIEMNSYKFSQNANYSDCTMAATLAILENMAINTGVSAGKLVSALKHQLEHWSPLLQRMSIGMEEEKSIVLALESAATSGGAMGDTLSKPPTFRFLLQTLHDEEIVGEEAILSWAEERRKDDIEQPRAKLFLQQPTQDFLEWLQEESDDDDEEDSDDEESE